MKIVRPMTVNDAQFVSSNIAENDYAAWSGATTYALGDTRIVVGTNEHTIYESLQGTNLNHTPSSSPTWWLATGKVNRWKMFDALVNSQSSRADNIDVVLTGDDRIDTVVLFNVSAATAQLTVTDATDGLVYDETQTLSYDSGFTNWYDYFFEPIERIIDVLFDDIPPYADATIEIILTDTGATVLCGEAVLGLSKNTGETEIGVQIGIQDYSVKTTDDFGNFTILERAFARRATFSVLVASEDVDLLINLLASYRATRIVYIGAEAYRTTIVYGFYRDFSIDIAYPTHSVCSIEIEGLT